MKRNINWNTLNLLSTSKAVAISIIRLIKLIIDIF